MIEEKVSVENVDGKKFRLNFFEFKESAILTHYLHNQKSDVTDFYKKHAIAYFKNELNKEKLTEDEEREVAENALQYALFKMDKEVPFPPPTKPKFKFIDLFAGIGGFRLALQNLGGKRAMLIFIENI